MSEMCLSVWIYSVQWLKVSKWNKRRNKKHKHTIAITDHNKIIRNNNNSEASITFWWRERKKRSWRIERNQQPKPNQINLFRFFEFCNLILRRRLCISACVWLLWLYFCSHCCCCIFFLSRFFLQCLEMKRMQIQRNKIP